MCILVLKAFQLEQGLKHNYYYADVYHNISIEGSPIRTRFKTNSTCFYPCKC